MKLSQFLKTAIFVLLGYLITACGLRNPSAAITTPTHQPKTLTVTIQSPTKTNTRLSPTGTNTPIPCDPEIVDFCIENGYFVFQFPIAPTNIDIVDRGYPYGSTEGGKREPHHGVEFEDPKGTPVLAAADGIVYFAGNDSETLFSISPNYYGTLVVIEHSIAGLPYKKMYTLYAHLSKIEVSQGQEIHAEQEIGQVGMTGVALGNHLHFEVRLQPNDSSSTLNPELWLQPHPGNGTLAIRLIPRGEVVVTPHITVQYFPDPNKPAVAAFPLEPYSADTFNPDDIWKEIAALGDQPAGRYRVTVIWEGPKVYEKWIDIQEGKLTLVELVEN